MSRDYITKEVEAIINDKSLEQPLNYAMAAAWILGNYKGMNLKVLDIRKGSSIADVFVIGSATNPMQATAMAEEISHQMRVHNQEALSKEGLKNSTDWILLDYGDFIVHVFNEAARTIYDLDGLYSNAEAVSIPESYYFSTPESERRSGSDDGQNYF